MDMKLLDGETQKTELGIDALISIASRKKRKDFFYNSLIRCAILSLLFIAFGCFLAIYKEKSGIPFSFLTDGSGSVFNFRKMLKELFTASLIPSVCFALCFSFGGRLCRLCDTVFPAVYGTLAGAFFYTEISLLVSSFSVSYFITLIPHFCFVLLIITVYTLFCPVCASYGECRRQNSALKSDSNSCFTYFLSANTILALSVILRDTAALFFKMFD